VILQKVGAWCALLSLGTAAFAASPLSAVERRVRVRH
jgi:hypothetical protein